MFLKKIQYKKGDRRHIYWALVESYRTPRGPRHRIAAHLGELKDQDHSGWVKLTGMLNDKLSRVIQADLFEQESEDEAVPAQITVRIKGIRV